jgi:predicted permease
MESVSRNLRYAVRTLRRNPGFAAVALLTLALGIGANSAIFTVVDAVLLRPLPYAAPEGLVRLSHEDREEGIRDGSFSPPDFEDLAARSTAFERLAAYFYSPGQSGMNLRGSGEPLRLETAFVSREFFPALGVAAEAGRTLAPDENTPGSDRVVVISHRLWRSRFGEDRAIVGRRVSLDGEPFTVVGVMPPSFEYPARQTDVWVPLSLIGEDDIPRQRGLRWLSVFGRLRDGATLESARTETDAILRQIAEAHPESNEGWTTAGLRSLRDEVVGDVRPVLLVLLGAVGLVLLIACANLANLLLVRGTARSREIAIRGALGAERGHLVRQMMTESLVIAVLGGVLGLVLAVWGVDVLTALAGDALPRRDALAPNARVLAFTLAVSLLTGLVFGLLPALRSSRVAIGAVLRGGRGDTDGRERQGVRSALVVAEVALAVVLLVGGGLMLRSLWKLVNVDPGFRSENVLALSVTLDDGLDPAVRFRRRDRIIDRISELPGVVAVGGSKTMPLHGGGEPVEFTLPERPGTAFHPDAGTFLVTPGYFRALRIPLRRGRGFTDADTIRPVLIVSESMARRLWPGEDPVGRSLQLTPAVGAEVVGVVADVRTEGLTKAPGAAAYLPSHFAPRSTVKLFVRTTRDPLSLAAAVRRAVWEVDPAQPISEMAALGRVVGETITRPRLFAMLLGLFSALALALALIGIYGVISYGVAQRTREIGIRIALGADRAAVLRDVVGRTARLTAAGLAAGIVGALALTRVLAAQLYGVGPTDVPTFVAVAVLLSIVALVAGYLPARRAAAVDPAIALRYE